MIGKLFREYGKRKIEFLEEKDFEGPNTQILKILSSDKRAIQNRVLQTVPTAENKKVTSELIMATLEVQNSILPANISPKEGGGFVLMFSSDAQCMAFSEAFKDGMTVKGCTVPLRRLHALDVSDLQQTLKRVARSRRRDKQKIAKQFVQTVLYPRSLADSHTLGGLLHPLHNCHCALSSALPALAKAKALAETEEETKEETKEPQSEHCEEDTTDAKPQVADAEMDDFLADDSSDTDRVSDNEGDDPVNADALEVDGSDNDSANDLDKDMSAALPLSVVSKKNASTTVPLLRCWWKCIPDLSHGVVESVEETEEKQQSGGGRMQHFEKRLWNALNRGLSCVTADVVFCARLTLSVEHVLAHIHSVLKLSGKHDTCAVDRMLTVYGPMASGLLLLLNNSLPLTGGSRKKAKSKRDRKTDGRFQPDTWPTIGMALSLNLRRSLESGKGKDDMFERRSEESRLVLKECQFLAQLAKAISQKESTYLRQWSALKRVKGRRSGQDLVAKMSANDRRKDVRRVFVRKQYTGLLTPPSKLGASQRSRGEDTGKRQRRRKPVNLTHEMLPSVPMLRLSLPQCRVNVDLIVFEPQRDGALLVTDRLLRKVMEWDTRVRPLAIAVLQWAKSRNVLEVADTCLDHVSLHTLKRSGFLPIGTAKHRGGRRVQQRHALNRKFLSTLAWITLVIKFLQCKSELWQATGGKEAATEWQPILPLFKVDETSGAVLTKNVHLCCDLADDGITTVARNRLTVAALLRSFFAFCNCLDFNHCEVDINDAELNVSKTAASDGFDSDDLDGEDSKAKTNVSWTIRHPLVSAKVNLASHINKWSAFILSREWQRAVRCFETAANGELAEDPMAHASIWDKLMAKVKTPKFEVASDPKMQHKVLVISNIAKSVSTEALTERISRVCKPLSVEHSSENNKAYAAFAESREAHVAMAELNRTLINGRRVYVRFAPDSALQSVDERYDSLPTLLKDAKKKRRKKALAKVGVGESGSKAVRKVKSAAKKAAKKKDSSSMPYTGGLLLD